MQTGESTVKRRVGPYYCIWQGAGTGANNTGKSVGCRSASVALWTGRRTPSRDGRRPRSPIRNQQIPSVTSYTWAEGTQKSRAEGRGLGSRLTIKSREHNVIGARPIERSRSQRLAQWHSSSYPSSLGDRLSVLPLGTHARAIQRMGHFHPVSDYLVYLAAAARGAGLDVRVCDGGAVDHEP